MRIVSGAALLLLISLAVRSCQELSGASAPSPAGVAINRSVIAGAPESLPNDHAADMVFIISADQAKLGSDSSLMMLNISTSAQYLSKGSRAGVLPIKSLVGSKQGSRYLAPNGEWLGTPDAALMATSDGIEQTVLLSLANPVFHENEQVLTFRTAHVIPADLAALKTTGGITARIVNAAMAGIGAPLRVTIAPNTTWTTAALFIEISQGIMMPKASTEGLMTDLAEKAVGVVVSAGVNVAAKAATTVASKAIDNMADRGKSSSSAGRKAM